jgi:hypothetical protein
MIGSLNYVVDRKRVLGTYDQNTAWGQNLGSGLKQYVIVGSMLNDVLHEDYIEPPLEGKARKAQTPNKNALPRHTLTFSEVSSRRQNRIFNIHTDNFYSSGFGGMNAKKTGPATIINNSFPLKIAK